MLFQSMHHLCFSDGYGWEILFLGVIIQEREECGHRHRGHMRSVLQVKKTRCINTDGEAGLAQAV